MIRSATFSKDRSRRFELIRDFRDETGAPDKTVLFVMLNPSKAGEKEDDPTIRKTVGFARRWGYGRVAVVNLNPIVSTDPWALPPWVGIDTKNKAVIESWVILSDLVVVAWGSPPRAIGKTIELPELLYSFREIAQIQQIPLYCIGMTKRRDPLHPSRAPYTNGPKLWASGPPAQGEQHT
jgi:hypothetical protein